VNHFIIVGYLITCNSTDDWHRTVSYAVAGNKSLSGVFHHLIGLTHYKVQVFAVLTKVTDGRMMMYKSMTVELSTIEGGELAK
jgi:hypothetical protein